MKPLSERDENNSGAVFPGYFYNRGVGMKPLSERDENHNSGTSKSQRNSLGRNEATL